MATGFSMGVLSYGGSPPLSYGGRTPLGAYNADGFETPDSDDCRMTLEQINRIRAELEAGERRQREAQQASSSSARSDLSDAASQSLLRVFLFMQWQQMKKKKCHLWKHQVK